MSKLLLSLICLGFIIIVYGGNDSIDLELRLAVGNSNPTSDPITPINETNSKDNSLDNNSSEVVTKPKRRGRKKSIVPMSGAERQRIRRKRIQERGPKAIKEEKEKQREYQARRRMKVRSDPKTHAAYKANQRKFYQLRKLKNHNQQ